MNAIRILNNSERVVIVREVAHGDSGRVSRETWVLYPMSSTVADTEVDFVPFVQEVTE